MVVDGIHDGVDCFISEIGEIKISGITDEQLNVRIETGGTEIFNESYYALKGNVVIHEIGEMLRSHFSLHDPKGMSNNVVSYYQAPLSITAVFSDKQDTVRRSFNAYYSRCRTSVSPSDVLFLTHESTIRTAHDRMEYLTFTAHKGMSVDMSIAYMDAGKEKYKTVSEQVDATAGMLAVSFSLDKIVRRSGIAVSSITYYDVLLKKDGTVKDKVRFVNDDRQYRNVTNFIYRNAFGMPETMAFTGLVEYSPELEGDPVELLQRTVRTSSKYIDSRTVNSGYLDTRQYGKVLDLITTDSLQLYNTETSTEVVTTDIDFSHKRTGNEKINVSLTFRQASRLHLASSVPVTMVFMGGYSTEHLTIHLNDITIWRQYAETWLWPTWTSARTNADAGASFR